MARIDFYLSVISPFTYFCGTRAAQIAEAHGAELVYKPLDIIGLFGRTGGVPPGQRHPNRQAYRLQELARSAQKTGLPYTETPAHFPTNQAPASYAVIAAQNAGGGDMAGLVHSLLRACWAEEKDIAEDAVIKACLSQAGFDPSLADSGLLAGAETYAANLEAAVEAGVFGAPFFVVDSGQMFWGHDRLDDLDAHLAGHP